MIYRLNTSNLKLILFIYIYNGNKKLSMDELNAIENAIRWDYVKEDFERDRHRKESIFYGM